MYFFIEKTILFHFFFHKIFQFFRSHLYSIYRYCVILKVFFGIFNHGLLGYNNHPKKDCGIFNGMLYQKFLKIYKSKFELCIYTILSY